MARSSESAGSSASDSTEDLEMQENFGTDEEQSSRLLPREEKNSNVPDQPQYKVERHLRTGWVILGSILTVVLVFMAMLSFTTYFVVKDVAVQSISSDSPTTFRRPSSDYILDSAWRFDAPAQIRQYSWTIKDIVANPDGVYRPMLSINGQFPGPLIECNEGDTLVVEVDNQSTNATSVHFHGIYQNGTNHMDGTIGITQCPIAPGHKFTYKFTVTGQSGTYWYHGHQAVQAADGLFGPLVVHARNEKELQKIPYASDRVVMVQDFYYDLSSPLLWQNLEPGSEDSPIPDGALINGRNVRDCSTVPDRMCDNSSAVLPTFDLAPNENHRLRFINVGSFAWFQIGVDEHHLAITEVDGTDVEPSSSTRLMISPAQRYSMVVSTNQSSSNSYWLRAHMVTHCFSDPKLPGHGAEEVRAIVSYKSPLTAESTAQAPAYPTSQNWPQGLEVICRDQDTTIYSPIPAIAAPSKADHSYYLRANLEIGNWRLERGFFNTSTFRGQLGSPSLHRAIHGLQSGNETFNTTLDGMNDRAFDKTNEFTIQHNGIKTVDLIIQNFDEGNHPMHLHGHKYWVLGQGHGYFPGYDKFALDLKNPMRRDTASVEGFGWILIRFVTDNPGMWAFHCHMAWHSEAGMTMQFFSQPEVVEGWELPQENKELCEAKGIERGAGPKDDIWFGFGIS
jgi:FtsP/CotA-like multicopper oxidase with cupredoxin domain